MEHPLASEYDSIQKESLALMDKMTKITSEPEYDRALHKKLMDSHDKLQIRMAEIENMSTKF